jgi:hypothetical protein
MVGPLVFGIVATSTSFRSAWVLAGATLLVAAGIVAFGRRLLLHARTEREVTQPARPPAA